MDRIKAKNILEMLDKLNSKIDLLGNILVNRGIKPVPVHAKVKHYRKFQ